MTDRPISETSPRQVARIAGVAYLIIFVLAIFFNFVVREGLIEPGDAAATATNIVDNEGLFRLGVVSFMVVFVADLVVAWALYIFFRNLSKDLSLLTAWFRLIYSVFLGVGVIFLFEALQLLSGADYLTVFDNGQLSAQTMVALDGFKYAWLIGLLIFGIHLILLGYLVVKSGYVSKALGYVLMVAGAAYAIDTLANALLSNYDDFETVFMVLVAVPSAIGELWLALWLLLKAGKSQEATIQGI